MRMQDGQNLSSLVTLPGENIVLEVETIAAIRVEGVLGILQTQRITVPRIYRDVMNGGVAGENRFKNFVNQNRTKNPVRIRPCI